MQPSVGCKKGWNKLLKRCQEFGWTRLHSAAAVLSRFCHRKTLQHPEQEISLPLLITNNLYLLLHFWVFFCFALEGTEQVVIWSCMWCWGIPPLCSLQSVVCDKNTYLLLKMLEFLPKRWRRSYTSFVKLIGKLEWEKFSSYLQAQKVTGRTRQIWGFWCPFFQHCSCCSWGEQFRVFPSICEELSSEILRFVQAVIAGEKEPYNF